MLFICLVFLHYGSKNSCSVIVFCILALIKSDGSSTFLFLCFYSNFREYGLLLVRCGLIGEAMKEFEDLELWDNLIYCYRYNKSKMNKAVIFSPLIIHLSLAVMFI